MTDRRPPRRAAVLAAALNSWAKTTSDNTEPAARLELRQAPTWGYVGKTTLTGPQIDQIIGLLRADLTPEPTEPPKTPMQAAAAVDQILAEYRAAGRTTVRPDDLIAELPRIGRTRQWLATHLVGLADDGYLHETWRPGVYRI